MRDARERLMLEAAGVRHGVVPAAQPVPASPAEPAGFHNWAVPGRDRRDGWRSASGGASWSEPDARLAAIGEALERYAAATPLAERDQPADDAGAVGVEDHSLYSDEQRRQPAFPFRAIYEEPGGWVRATALPDLGETWVPSALVRLDGHPAHALASSNGLALGRSLEQALVTAIRELVERDALTVAWLHSLPGREVAAPESWHGRLDGLHADVHLLDLSAAHCPWPVAAVAGSIPLRGRPRYSLGAACHVSWSAAAEKAFLEWCQGVAFVSHFVRERPSTSFSGPLDVRTFDDHAVYYSVRPREWASVPLLRTRRADGPGEPADPSPSWSAQLDQARCWIAESGVRMRYVVLRPADLRQLGLWAVKALSPDLVPIFPDQRWPHLGGTCRDAATRFPDLAHLSRFPNPLPHPLG
jgi:ribosomal protein S12 methylthiotransferase accessory factor